MTAGVNFARQRMRQSTTWSVPAVELLKLMRKNVRRELQQLGFALEALQEAPSARNSWEKKPDKVTENDELPVLPISWTVINKCGLGPTFGLLPEQITRSDSLLTAF